MCETRGLSLRRVHREFVTSGLIDTSDQISHVKISISIINEQRNRDDRRIGHCNSRVGGQPQYRLFRDLDDMLEIPLTASDRKHFNNRHGVWSHRGDLTIHKIRSRDNERAGGQLQEWMERAGWWGGVDSAIVTMSVGKYRTFIHHWNAKRFHRQWIKSSEARDSHQSSFSATRSRGNLTVDHFSTILLNEMITCPVKSHSTFPRVYFLFRK